MRQRLVNVSKDDHSEDKIEHRRNNWITLSEKRQLIPSPSIFVRNRNFLSSIDFRSHISIREYRATLDSNELGTVNAYQIKSFLRQKNVDFSESHSCFAVQVPRHLLLSNKADVKWTAIEESVVPVYVNKTTGTFIAPDLALGGDWATFKEFILIWLRKRTSSKSTIHVALPQLESFLPASEEDIPGISIWKLAEPVESLSSDDFRSLLKALKISTRYYHLEHFSNHDAKVILRQGDDGKIDDAQILFPVRYITGELIGFRRIFICPHERTIKEETISHSTSHQCHVFPFPHGLDRAHRSHASSIVIVSSILDSLTLTALSPPGQIFPVTLPEGIAALSPDHLPFIENFYVTFWFPDTTTAFEALKTFAKKIGEKRCSMISREIPQPSQYLKELSKEIIASFLERNTKKCSHEYITTFESFRQDVLAEFINADEVKGVPWKRFPLLTELLQGFRRGELTVFTGRTGSGKTTVLSELTIDLCKQNVTTLWGSFEVKNTRLAKMQLKQFSAVNIEDHIDSFDKWADLFQKLPMYYLTFHGSEAIDKVLDAMGHAVYLYDIHHVIIDNVQFMMGDSTATAMDRYFTQDKIIGKFRKFATLHNVHVTLVIHPRKEDVGNALTTNSIFGGAKATQEADNVVLLQEEEITPRVKRKYLQVVKNRFSGDLGTVPLLFNKGTLTFSKKIYMREKKGKKEVTSAVLEQDSNESSSSDFS